MKNVKINRIKAYMDFLRHEIKNNKQAFDRYKDEMMSTTDLTKGRVACHYMQRYANKIVELNNELDTFRKMNKRKKLTYLRSKGFEA